MGKANFSKLSIMQNKFLSTILEERLNLPSILSTENNITKFLSYKEAIKEHATKTRKKLLQRCLGQLINKNIMLFFWIL